jgi:hypothetical protein
MRFLSVAILLFVPFQQLFAIPLFGYPMKAVWSFASPRLQVKIANRMPAVSPPRKIR